MLRAFLLGSILLSTTAFAAIDPSVEFKPVHEALITRISALAPIEVLATQPPAPKVETPPAQPKPNTVWIPGYWAWDHEAKSYIWICGIWRLFPANQTWVSGYWNQSNGWWWVGGYWTVQGANSVVAKVAPPSTAPEKVGSPPNNNSFWAPGYWNFNAASQSYSWLGGSWQPFDANVVFVPGYWQYRPEGYMFHPSCWDWKLEDRGVAYDCQSNGAVLVALAPEVIISRIYVYYPDYHIFFWFHWHCCHDYWDHCWCMPPWWGWWGWWTFDWFDLWGLWWWWGHPGFVGPPWLFPVFFSHIAPPSDEAIHFFENAPTPPFITPNGIPSFDDWLDAIEEITGDRTPLVPEDQFDDAADEAGQGLPETDSRRPSGDGKPGEQPRPDFGDTVDPQGTAPVPPLPTPPQETAPVPPRPTPPVTPPDNYTPPTYQPPTYQPPTYIPPVNQPPTISPPIYVPPFNPRPPHWERPPGRPDTTNPNTNPPLNVPPRRTPPSTQTPPQMNNPNRTPNTNFKPSGQNMRTGPSLNRQSTPRNNAQMQRSVQSNQRPTGKK